MISIRSILARRTWNALQNRCLKYELYIAGFLSLIAIWHVASVYLVRSVLFPPPKPVLERSVELLMSGVLAVQVGASMQRIILGFMIGSAIGILIGLLMGSFQTIQRLLDPYVETLRFIPAVAMITVAVIWFGIGEASKIFIITYSTLFTIIITTTAGVSSIAPNKVRAAKSLGASTAQTFFFVTLPAAIPSILTGMRVAMANAFVTIVAAELVAANKGIGTMLWNARLFMQVDDIFVALLSLALVGFVIDRCFRWAIVTFAGRYSPSG